MTSYIFKADVLIVHKVCPTFLGFWIKTVVKQTCNLNTIERLDFRSSWFVKWSNTYYVGTCHINNFLLVPEKFYFKFHKTFIIQWNSILRTKILKAHYHCLVLFTLKGSNTIVVHKGKRQSAWTQLWTNSRILQQKKVFKHHYIIKLDTER